MPPLELPPARLPELIREAGRELAEKGFTCVCPAARTDADHTVLLCGVEKSYFKVENNPLTVLMWCASPEYAAAGEKGCPVWQAQFDEPDIIDTVVNAQAQAKQDEITRQQIISGVRVNDRDVEEPDGTA